ncbi:MAG: OB-fold nucleic acid binding domain-containing protein [Prevotella sp.]|nr:OB-fold nucleic acid binding domain-containing protein [Prevotella sp.]
MKKLFYSLFTLAIAAFTFTSCESVPAPYDDPNLNPGGGSTVVVDPTGDGTVESPYNVIAAINYAKNLEVGAESDRDIYIKGVVVSIAENYTTQYGNARFYISDDGTAKNQFLIYRALYLGNKKYTDGDVLVEGDTVIICGRVTNYNGTLETQQNKAFLYSLNGKSEGGGSGGGATGEAKGSGTLEDPYNPAGVIAYINTLGADVESANNVYIKGKVASITEQYGTQYGNATFNIVEEGAEGTPFTVFRALYLGNKKYTSGDVLKEGDEVVVCGKVVNYKGNTPETAQGKAFLYSLNGKSEGGGGDTPTPTGEEKGDGTLNNPFNAVAANNFASKLAADAKSDKDVYIKGKISKIANNGEFGTQYGNASFYISDDGTTNNEFYVFRTLYLGNKKYDNTSDPNIKVGDEVIICGKVTNYKGNTPETSANESYIYSLNGKTEGGGGGDTPQGAGTYESPLTVSQAISLGNADAVWVKGYVVGFVSGQVLSSGATFSAEGAVNTNLLIAESATETNVSRCMPIQLSRDYRADFALDANPGLLGKEIIMAGQLTAYFSVPGIKSPTYMEANGKSVGNKVKYRKR